MSRVPNRARTRARSVARAVKQKAERAEKNAAGSHDKLGRYLCLQLADELDTHDPNRELLRRIALDDISCGIAGRRGRGQLSTDEKTS